MKKFIYKITNQINGKIYIGQTNNFVRRVREHKNINNDKEEYKVLYRAMRKHGVKNFIFEIIEETENYNEREKYWIKYYNSYIKNKNSNGYNMTEGGELPPVWRKEEHPMCSHTQQQINEIINLLKNTSLNTEEIAKKYNYNCSSINRINNGELWYDENISYPIKKEKTRQFYIARALNIIEDLKNSSLTQKEIAKKYEVARTTITAINNGQNCRQQNIIYPIRIISVSEINKKSVKQFDLNNNFIKEYESVSAAARELKVHQSAISACARKETKTAYGFIWKY